MSMHIIKAGVLDTFQDSGRSGWAKAGIGQGGCMDILAGRLANSIAGNGHALAVLEMHFPAPVLRFATAVTVALSGADFGAVCNGVPLSVNRRWHLPADSLLSFKRKITGQRAYLAVQGGWKIPEVLNGFGTHLKAGFGGWQGGPLRNGQVLPLAGSANECRGELPVAEAFFADPGAWYRKRPVTVMAGPEWHNLTYAGQKNALNQPFVLDNHSDRMAYRLKGPVLERKQTGEMKSGGVLPGTIQLLPEGTVLLLMADCQTTGGYPRILQVAAADLPLLAQTGPGETVHFEWQTMEYAQKMLALQEAYVHQIALAARNEPILSGKNR